MARGSVETLKSGFRARVYAGKDPITGKQTYVRGQVRREFGDAERDCTRLLSEVEADSQPDRSATVATLMKAWMEVADHELTTRETTAGYVRRVINPALGDWTLRKLQYRVDVLDRVLQAPRSLQHRLQGTAVHRAQAGRRARLRSPEVPTACLQADGAGVGPPDPRDPVPGAGLRRFLELD
jgi:hypothetical protein